MDNRVLFNTDTEVTAHDFGTMLLIIGIIASYIIFVMWLAEEFDDHAGKIMLCGLLLPFFIGGFILI